MVGSVGVDLRLDYRGEGAESGGGGWDLGIAEFEWCVVRDVDVELG